MKAIFLTPILALLTSIPLLAELPLKLELMAPEEPVTLQEADEAKPGDKAKGLAEEAKGPTADVTLRYRITNTGKEDIVMDHGGDSTTNRLMIKGPGAKNHPYRGMMTMEFRMGKPVTIKAGESKEYEIKGLKYGKRDMSFWTISQAGDYTVSLMHRTRSGNANVSLTSNTVKFSVVAK